MDNCLKQQEKEIDAFIKLNADFQLMYMMEVFLGRRPNQDLHRLVGIYKQSVCSQEFTLENRHITKRIKQYFGDRPKESIRILDHGSGAWGATVFLLMALGYKKVSGLHIDNVDLQRQQSRYRALPGTRAVPLPHDRNRLDSYGYLSRLHCMDPT